MIPREIKERLSSKICKIGTCRRVNSTTRSTCRGCGRARLRLRTLND